MKEQTYVGVRNVSDSFIAFMPEGKEKQSEAVKIEAKGNSNAIKKISANDWIRLRDSSNVKDGLLIRDDSVLEADDTIFEDNYKNPNSFSDAELGKLMKLKSPSTIRNKFAEITSCFTMGRILDEARDEKNMIMEKLAEKQMQVLLKKLDVDLYVKTKKELELFCREREIKLNPRITNRDEIITEIEAHFKIQ